MSRRNSASPIILLLSLLAPGLASAGVGQWTSHGPNGGTIRALTINPVTPGVAYAAVEMVGVAKSTDGGTTWAPASVGITGSILDIRAFAIDPATPTTVYAGGEDGVFKSTDAGATWTLTPSPILVEALAIDPITPTTLYAGTLDSGIHKTVNGGASWVPSGAGLTVPAVFALVIDPTTSATMYAATGDGVFKSANGGTSWTPANSGFTFFKTVSLAIDPADPLTLYAINGDVLFKTTNGAASWTLLGAPISVVALVIDPTAPNILYVAGAGSVFKSTDGGANWIPANSDLTGVSLAPRAPLALDPVNPSTLLLGTQGLGIYKTTDGGGSWISSSAGLGAQVTALAASPLALYAGAVGLAGSIDGGESWIDVAPTNTGITALAVDPVTPTTLYSGHGPGLVSVQKSTDGGFTWQPLTPDLWTAFHLAIDPATPTTLYAGGDGPGSGLAKSTDGGASWSVLNVPAPLGSQRVFDIAIDPHNPTTVYTIEGGLYAPVGLFKSVDGGHTWLQLSQLGGVIALDPVTPGTLYVAKSGGGIVKSVDSGETWNLPQSGFFPLGISAMVIDPVNPTIIYVGTNGDGVFESRDAGLSLHALNAGLASHRVGQLVLDRTGLHAGTSAGVYDLARPPSVGLSLTAGPLTGGDLLRVDARVSNAGPETTVDVFLGVLLPAAMGPGVGCPAGDAVAFVADAFTRIEIRCLSSSPQGFPALFPGLTLERHLPATTLPDFFTSSIPVGLPAGAYTVFFAITPANAFADGVLDPTDLIAFATATFTVAP
jgi:photosystem II stability/assembly factor-like uncharacterized protein